MNIFHIRNLGWYPEDMDQVYGENKDMEESIRTMVNMIRHMCCTFFKMPASRVRTWRSPIRMCVCQLF